MMIYQGDNWPAEYRDRAYLLSLFGHRTNVEIIERSGSGFVSKRAPEPDLFDMPDPWYRGIDIGYGPDGGVFISDWTDTGDYHNRTGENRLSGRIYKITYGDAKPSSGSDMTRLTVEQLVALNTHANEWFPRQARVEFSYRMVDGRGVGNAKQLLRDQFARETDVPRKLRALWTLYTIGGTDEAFLLPLLKSPNEHLRAWGIRILAEHWPLDALHTTDDPVTRTSVFTQQRPAAVIGGAEPTRSPAVDRGADAACGQRTVQPGSARARVDDAAPVLQPAGRRRRGTPRAQRRCDRQEPPADGLVRVDSDRARPIRPRSPRSPSRASCAPPPSTSPGVWLRTSPRALRRSRRSCRLRPLAPRTTSRTSWTDSR